MSLPEKENTNEQYEIEIRPNSFPERWNHDIPQANEPIHSNYTAIEKRLETFKDWPIGIKQRPKELADAGFFYTGKGDKTLCFCCGGGLNNWAEDDDPWEQHAKWFSLCSYLVSQKGNTFISKVAEKSNTYLSAKEVSDIISNKDESSQNQLENSSNLSTNENTCEINHNDSSKNTDEIN